MGPTKPRRSGRRLGRLLLLFGTVVIGYIDRSNLALVAPKLGAEFRMDSIRLGLVLSAFGWAYAAFQLPGGWIVDRVPPRLLYLVMLGGWSVATGALALARGFGSLFGLRLGVGLFEAPSFPANNQVVTAWFPEAQRARAIGFYTSGQFVGLAFLSPVLVALQIRWGWQAVFIATGVAGAIWGILWYTLCHDPLDLAVGDGRRTAMTWPQWRAILRSRNLWGVILGHTCGMVTLWFFLTWFPAYLVTYRHMGFMAMGLWIAVPYLAAFFGTLASGVLSDWILSRGADVGTARKVPVICGFCLTMFILGGNYAERPWVVMLFMTIACFGHGFSSLGWTFVSLLAPEGLIGLTGGIYNFIGNSAAIFVPITIGILVRGGRFEPALVFIFACAMVGVFAFAFLVRDVRPIGTEPPTGLSGRSVSAFVPDNAPPEE